MIGNAKNKVVDFYLNHALKVDFTCIVIIWILNIKLPIFNFKFPDKAKSIEILTDTISASISLAGFILASLTIIATMKSNIANRLPETARNPLELFFSPGNYLTMMTIFQGAIKELTFSFLAAYVTWLSSENIDRSIIFLIDISLIFLIFISVFRSLMVLYKVINIRDCN